jgi:hypothetical protein
MHDIPVYRRNPKACHVEQDQPTKEGGRRRNIHGMSPGFALYQGVLSILEVRKWILRLRAEE